MAVRVHPTWECRLRVHPWGCLPAMISQVWFRHQTRHLLHRPQCQLPSAFSFLRQAFCFRIRAMFFSHSAFYPFLSCCFSVSGCPTGKRDFSDERGLVGGCLSVCLSVGLFVCLSVFLSSVCLSSVCLSVRLSVCLCFCLSSAPIAPRAPLRCAHAHH